MKGFDRRKSQQENRENAQSTLTKKLEDKIVIVECRCITFDTKLVTFTEPRLNTQYINELVKKKKSILELKSMAFE